MNITALHRPETDIPLERLSGNATLTDQEKIGEVSRQFEAVLVRKILAETQKPVIKNKFSDNSTAGNIYRDLIGNQIADSITKSGAIGLAKSLGGQLNHQLMAKTATETPLASNSLSRPELNELLADSDKSAAPNLAFLPTRP
jgi:Rod binding domain-containing protein